VLLAAEPEEIISLTGGGRHESEDDARHGRKRDAQEIDALEPERYGIRFALIEYRADYSLGLF
jgi:hypothetical protein